MNEPTDELQEHIAKPWYRKELTLFVGGSIVIALVLVSMSMALYVSSGASLLDASKPGFKKVQQEVDQSDNFEAFSSDGSVTADTLTQFQQLYDKQVQPVSSPTVFDPAALDDQALGIGDPSASN